MRRKRNVLPEMNESGWYAKIARYGNLRGGRRDPIIVFSQSPAEAEKYFADRAKTLPGSLGLNGEFDKKLHGPFLTSEKAKEFFVSQGHSHIVVDGISS